MSYLLIFILLFCEIILECSSARYPITEKEIECFSQEKIYDKQTDKCYKLLTTGPCPRDHWFVLEKPKEQVRTVRNLTIRAKCVKEKCQDGEYYWSATKSCVQAKDKKRVCGNDVDEELLNNVFGEGECICARDPPRARLNGDKRNRCYPLYMQGPCQPGQVLGFLGKSEQATCIHDPCYTETMHRKRMKTAQKEFVLAPWENGTCYELGTQGPCSEGLTFKICPDIMRPVCVSLVNQIFKGRRTCTTDENGDCVKIIKNNKVDNRAKFMKELLLALKKSK